MLIVSFLQSIFVSADSLKLILLLQATNSEWAHIQAHQSALSLTRVGLIHLPLQLRTLLKEVGSVEESGCAIYMSLAL